MRDPFGKRTGFSIHTTTSEDTGRYGLKIFKDIWSLLMALRLVDIIFFFAVLILMILIVTLIYFIKINKWRNKNENCRTMDKSRKN